MPNMEQFQKKILEARAKGFIHVFNYEDILKNNLEYQLYRLIQNNVIDHTDPPIFDLVLHLCKEAAKTQSDKQLEIHSIPMYQEGIKELLNDLQSMLKRKEYEMEDKAYVKLKEIIEKFNKTDWTYKYRIEFHDNNGLIKIDNAS